MRITPFLPEHLPDYASWFNDPKLHKVLGPTPDEEWLAHALNDTHSCQYSVFLENELVGVVGMVLPDDKHPWYVITDIAIKPALQQKGIGSQIVQELQRLHPVQQYQSWKVFIDVDNHQAQSFFTKLGWSQQSDRADEHGMLTFECNL